MWKIQSLVVHILLTGSILTTYFQPTLLPNLVPQKTMRELGLEPPADRLVVFLTDGLRAATFFANNGSDIPDLRDIFRKQGRIGISRTCAPTMTRPGHIAIFGGFNEDPAAALVNFRYNPSNFDTVFNRSRNTIGWLHRNVKSYFVGLPHGGAPLRFEWYLEAQLPEKLTCDKWALEKVEKFLKNADNARDLKSQKSVVFFVYLADMDIAAHRYRPLSKRFHKKLQHTQRGIRRTYELFERVFNDSRTAYLMTSDHGMTDSGIHGGGSSHEVETPLFMWGAGVSREGVDPESTFLTNANISEVDQIQLAPLMSALIGLPPPMNNLALMPVGYLNVSREYEVMALHLNVLQLLDQAIILIRRHKNSVFHKWLPKFEELNLGQIDQYSKNIKSLLSQGNTKEAMETCQNFGKSAQLCLAYYHQYYQLPLMVATTASYLIWFYCLLLQLTRLCKREKGQRRGFQTVSTLILVLLSILLLVLLTLQNVPHITAFYLLLPIGMLIMAQAERPVKSFLIMKPIWNLVCILVPAGLLISMAIFYLHFGVLYLISVLLINRRAFLKLSIKLFVWLTTVILVSGLLFVQQYTRIGLRTIFSPFKSSHVLYISMLMAIIRPLILGHRHDLRVWAINTLALITGAYGVYQWEERETVSVYVYVTTWTFLIFAFLSIRYFAQSTPTGRRRFELITMNMVTIICLLASSWSSLNVQVIITELVLGLQVYEDSRKFNKIEEVEEEHKPLKKLKKLYRYAFMILLYFYVAFFLAGHWLYSFIFIATIARLFNPHFSFFLSGSLLILKILLPSLIFISALYVMVPFVRKNNRSILICVFLISDAMGLYMYFFVQNWKSWKRLRKCLDQVLLTHVVNYMLLGCMCLVKIFMANSSVEKPKHNEERSAQRDSSRGETQA